MLPGPHFLRVVVLLGKSMFPVREERIMDSTFELCGGTIAEPLDNLPDEFSLDVQRLCEDDSFCMSGGSGFHASLISVIQPVCGPAAGLLLVG